VAAGTDLRVTVCRARFRALSRVHFQGQAANKLRGALGFSLDENIFRPRLEGGPSGFKNPPRPFVVHASHLDDAQFEAGGNFEVDLALFYVQPELFHQALEKTGWAELTAFQCETTHLDLSPRQEAPPRVKVVFLTPTELKGQAGQEPPEFLTLMARLRDRISGLRAFYGPGPLALDFKRFLDGASQVRLVESQAERIRGERRSWRTGQTHPLGGFAGYAVYEGGFQAYLPFLEAGFYTGVGRQTVWGHGRIAVQPMD